MARLPDIPSIGTSEASVGVRRVFDAIRRAFTDINKSGGVETGASVLDKIESAINAGAGASTTHTPPKPANVVATGGFAYIMVSWDDPHFAYLAHAEVWRSTGTVISEATRVGTTNATMFSDLPPSQSLSVSYHYWVRFVSNDGTPQYGPWSDMATASTADDPAYVLEVLAGEIEASQLHADLNSRINLIDTDTTSPLSVAKRLANEATARQAAITTEQTARQSADSSLSSSITTLTASVNSNAAAISTEATARSNADSAEVTERKALATKVTGFADPAGKVLANLTSGLIYEEKTIRSSETSSIASSVSTLTTTVNGHTSTIQTQQTSINGLYAQYTVKVDVNGKVSGFGLASTSVSSLFEIVADRFAICNTSGSGKKYPFVVDSTYGVVMDSALIKDGTITNAKIASLAVNKLYAASGTMASVIIGTGHITNAMIGSVIQSSNYGSNTGWYINKDGTAIFNNVYARGDIEATSLKSNTLMVKTGNIDDLSVTTLKIADNAVVLPVGAFSSGSVHTSTVQTVTIEGTGAPIFLSATVKLNMEGTYTTTPPTYSLSIKRGGSKLATYKIPVVAGQYGYTIDHLFSASMIDTSLVTGNVIYSIEVSNSSISSSSRSLTAIVLKK